MGTMGVVRACSPTIANKIRLAETVGTSVRRLADEHGMTISALAKYCGVSTSVMGRIVAGAVPPSLTQFMALAETFDVTLDELVEGL